jgi:DNA-binding CsgD family transcriptional regulator
VRLIRSDLEGALGFLGEAGALTEVEPFTTPILALLGTLVGCEGVSYCEIDRVGNELLFYADTTGQPANMDDHQAYVATVHEHPVRRHRNRTGELGALKIYDFITPKQLRQTQFYADYLCRSVCPSGFLMSVCLPAPTGQTHTFIFDRETADFGERERTLLDLLQPHLAHLRRAGEIRRRARATIEGLPEGLLSERETEVLLHLAEGMRNREIAQALWIAPGTVHKHLNNIYSKLGVHTRAAAARFLHGGNPS